MSKGLYVGTIIFIFLVLVITLILILRKKRKKNIYLIINELEKEKNLLINVPVLNELNKVEALVKSNNKLKERYNTWKLKFEVIEKETIPKINDMLIEADFLSEKSSSNTFISLTLLFILNTLFQNVI